MSASGHLHSANSHSNMTFESVLATQRGRYSVAISTILLQLPNIDSQIKLYPWRCQDLDNNPPINLSTIHNNVFYLHTYVPHLACHQEGWRANIELGCMRYLYIFLKSSIKPPNLVAAIRPWLWVTKQGMWPWQIQAAEQTTCMGWLLFWQLSMT